MTLAIDTLVWLGAGDVQQSGLLDNASELVLVEARADSVKASQKLFANQANIRVEHLVLAAKQGEADFYHYNLPEFSALSEATGLKLLFPGLRLGKTETVSTVAIDSFISKLALDSSKPNMLVLDIIDQSLPLLQSLASAGLLTTFNQLQIVGSNEPLYQGAATSADIAEFLARHGYEVTNTDSSDPDLPVLSFRLNSLWQELVTSDQLRATLEERLKTTQQSNTALEKQLAEQTDQAEKNSNKLLRQLEEQKSHYEQKHAEISKQLTNTVSEKETLQQQLAAAKVAAEKDKAELNGRITGMDAELKKALQQLQAADQHLLTSKEEFNKQLQLLNETNATLLAQAEVYQQWQASQAQQSTEVEQKITTALVKHLGNSVKQLEAFISLRNLLSKGQMPLNYHGWPISADIALYLARKVITEAFDYIIEFGSGTSTIVFAQALETRKQKTAQEVGCKIISFEHNKTYLQKTSDDMQAHQVEQWVDLVYAPLTEQEFDGVTYLYYSCEAKLAELSAALQKQDAKILVLVDGPPANTGPMARYPAIPLILKHLSKHQLHIVMDDYVREDEKRAAGRWSKLFEERGIKHQKEMLNFEKVGFSWILNS